MEYDPACHIIALIMGWKYEAAHLFDPLGKRVGSDEKTEFGDNSTRYVHGGKNVLETRIDGEVNFLHVPGVSITWSPDKAWGETAYQFFDPFGTAVLEVVNPDSVVHVSWDEFGRQETGYTMYPKQWHGNELDTKAKLFHTPFGDYDPYTMAMSGTKHPEPFGGKPNPTAQYAYLDFVFDIDGLFNDFLEDFGLPPANQKLPHQTSDLKKGNENGGMLPTNLNEPTSYAPWLMDREIFDYLNDPIPPINGVRVGPGTKLNFANTPIKKPSVHSNPYLQGPNEQLNFVSFENLGHETDIRIYTVAGQLVAVLEKDDQSSHLRWDMRNEDGLPVASGVYYAQVETRHPDGEPTTHNLKFTVNREK